MRKLLCLVGLHRLHVVHRFGAGALIACPHCEREWGMHDGMRAFVPWDGDLEQLYQDFGFDVSASRAEWKRNKRPYPPNQIGSCALDARPPPS